MDKTILLLKIENKYVPIVESAVKVLANNEDHLNETNSTQSLPPVLPSSEITASVDPLNVLTGPRSLNLTPEDADKN